MKRFAKPFGGMAVLAVVLISASSPAAAQVSVSLPSLTASSGQNIDIAVTVGDLTGQDVLAYDFTVVYDSDILTLTGVTTTGTLSSGKSVVSNDAGAGHGGTFADGEGLDSAKVVMASATPLSGGGTLIKLKATVVGDGTSDLSFASFKFNDGVPAATTTDGELNSGNLPPTATDVSVSTDEDDPVTVTLGGSDPEGAALGFSIVSQPAHGSLGVINVTSSTAATVVYTPDSNYSGDDEFTYRATEGGRQSAAATVTITVEPVNDPPVTHPDEATTDAGEAVDIDAAANDEDVEGGVITAEPDPENMPVGGTLTSNPDGSLRYTPDEGFAGRDTFGYLAVDEDGGSSAGSIVVTVKAIVDLRISAEDSPDPVSAGGMLTYSLSADNAGPSELIGWQVTIFLPEGASFESVNQPGCLVGDANAVTCEGEGAVPTIDVTMTVPDEPGAVLTGSALIAVTDSPDRPQLDPDDSNNAVTITTNIETDADGVGDDEESGVPNLSGGGTGDGNGDGVPDAEQENVASLMNGTDGSYITIESDPGATLVNVAASPTPPQDAPPPPESVSFLDGFISFGIEGLGSGVATTVTIFTTKEANSYLKYGPTPDNAEPRWYEFLFDGTTGAEILEDRIILHLVDGMRGDADLTANGSIQDPGGPVFSTNASPSAADDTYELDEDDILTVASEAGVLANDTDPNGDALSVDVIVDVQHGSLELGADGSFVYTPLENYNGPDSFTYVVTDALASDTAEVTITVASVNDAPEAVDIIAPASDSEILVGGSADPVDGGTTLFSVTWEESSDADGDAVVYTVEFSGASDFSDLIEQIDAGSETGISISVAKAAEWFDEIHGSAELGADAAVFARVIASDAELTTAGQVTSFTLTRGTITGREGDGTLPEGFELRGNYPNPFNPATTIDFDLPSPAGVRLQVFDMLGREVLSVGPVEMASGANRHLRIDATALPSGIYIYRITATMNTEVSAATGRMTLVK